MGRVFRCVTTLALSLVLAAGFFAPASANSKYAAYVIHADSGDVLFDRYSTGKRYPASLTKMMTLYLLFEEIESGNLSLDSKLTVSSRAAGQPPSKLGVSSGSTIDVETAIKALVVKSANDVAVVVAEQISGTEWRFAQQMTTKARELGMRSTTFRNASGLPNSKQVTTARDMATLAQRLIQDFPQYFPYFATETFTWDGRTYRGHNSLVGKFEGADGMKTGYTRMSGFNLVTTAHRDGNRLIGVVLGGRKSYTRDKHMRDILTAGFNDITKKPALIAALYRETPNPRIKPTLLAKLESERAPPTIDNNEALRRELVAAATGLTASETGTSDPMATLIAFADTDDFNEFERTRLASGVVDEGFVGEGDREPANEFTWSIQIGAYSSKDLAQKELEEAVYKGGLMERSRVVMAMPKEDGTTLYRARVTKLTEIEAATACTTLSDKGLSCFVVSDADAKLQ